MTPSPAARSTDAAAPAMQGGDLASSLGAASMLLVFRLAGEAFAVPVTKVNEILDPMPFTDVPGASAFAPGLINVRGTIVPLLDIRFRLGIPPAEITGNSRVIVLEIPLDGRHVKLAISADAVEEVLDIGTTTIDRLPQLGARWPAAYVSGLAQYRDRLVVLLETEELFAVEDLPVAASKE